MLERPRAKPRGREGTKGRVCNNDNNDPSPPARALNRQFRAPPDCIKPTRLCTTDSNGALSAMRCIRSGSSSHPLSAARAKGPILNSPSASDIDQHTAALSNAAHDLALVYFKTTGFGVFCNTVSGPASTHGAFRPNPRPAAPDTGRMDLESRIPPDPARNANRIHERYANRNLGHGIGNTRDL